MQISSVKSNELTDQQDMFFSTNITGDPLYNLIELHTTLQYTTELHTTLRLAGALTWLGATSAHTRLLSSRRWANAQPRLLSGRLGCVEGYPYGWRTQPSHLYPDSKIHGANMGPILGSLSGWPLTLLNHWLSLREWASVDKISRPAFLQMTCSDFRSWGCLKIWIHTPCRQHELRTSP